MVHGNIWWNAVVNQGNKNLTILTTDCYFFLVCVTEWEDIEKAERVPSQMYNRMHSNIGSNQMLAMERARLERSSLFTYKLKSIRRSFIVLFLNEILMHPDFSWHSKITFKLVILSAFNTDKSMMCIWLIGVPCIKVRI